MERFLYREVEVYAHRNGECGMPELAGTYKLVEPHHNEREWNLAVMEPGFLGQLKLMRMVESKLIWTQQYVIPGRLTRVYGPLDTCQLVRQRIEDQEFSGISLTKHALAVPLRKERKPDPLPAAPVAVTFRPKPAPVPKDVPTIQAEDISKVIDSPDREQARPPSFFIADGIALGVGLAGVKGKWISEAVSAAEREERARAREWERKRMIEEATKEATKEQVVSDRERVRIIKDRYEAIEVDEFNRRMQATEQRLRQQILSEMNTQTFKGMGTTAGEVRGLSRNGPSPSVPRNTIDDSPERGLYVQVAAIVASFSAKDLSTLTKSRFENIARELALTFGVPLEQAWAMLQDEILRRSRRGDNIGGSSVYDI